jgi:hypothetical protein
VVRAEYRLAAGFVALGWNAPDRAAEIEFAPLFFAHGGTLKFRNFRCQIGAREFLAGGDFCLTD